MRKQCRLGKCCKGIDPVRCFIKKCMSKDGLRERAETACQTVKLESSVLAAVVGYMLTLHNPQPNSCIFSGTCSRY